MQKIKQTSSKIRGLIFDLDGTLTLTQQFHYQAFRKVFKKYGINYTKADDYQHAGEGSHCIFPEVFAQHGKKITEQQTAQYTEEKKVIYTKILEEKKIKTVPGVKNFVKKMHKLGLKMIVASGNKAESIEYILKKIGLRKYFVDFVTNKDVEKSKPAPDIFLKAAEKLGLKPSECIVFEDAVNGVKAAKAGKIPCIALTTGVSKEELLKAGAWWTIASYKEIPVPCFLETLEKDLQKRPYHSHS